MNPIRINFVDFWPGFKPRENFFIKVLGKYFPLELSDNPDILFFSNYGIKHLSYNCHKIQFTAENIRPDFRLADFIWSFDYNEDPRHLRLPLYVLYFDEKYTVHDMVRQKSAQEIDNIFHLKKKFCCFLVSNPRADVRIDFFNKLSEYKQVDSGGRVLNNIGGKPVENKLQWVKEYKFIIAFENSSYPGYTTEKVLEPKQVDTIPIYWGNPLVGQEMNTRSFVNYHDYNSFDKLVERIIEIDKNDDLYRQHLKECLFQGNKPNEYFSEERLAAHFQKAIDSRSNKPVSATMKYKKAKAGILINTYQKKIKQKVNDWL